MMQKLSHCRGWLHQFECRSICNGLGLGGLLRVRTAAGEAVDEVVRRPGTGELQVTLPHGCTGGGEFVVIALNVFAIDEMRDVKNHFAVFHQPAADLFVKGKKEAVHLEADSPGASLAFARASVIFAKGSKVFAADAVRGLMVIHLAAGAVIDEDLEVHFGLAAQFVDVGKKLALV